MYRLNRTPLALFAVGCLVSGLSLQGMQPGGAARKLDLSSPASTPPRSAALFPVVAHAPVVAGVRRDIESQEVLPEGRLARLKGWCGSKIGAVKGYFSDLSQGKKETIAAAGITGAVVSLNACQLFWVNTVVPELVSLAGGKTVATMLRRHNFYMRMLCGSLLVTADALTQNYALLGFSVSNTGLIWLPALMFVLQSAFDQWKKNSGKAIVFDLFYNWSKEMQDRFITFLQRFIAFAEKHPTIPALGDDAIVSFCAACFEDFNSWPVAVQKQFIAQIKRTVEAAQAGELSMSEMRTMVADVVVDRV